MYLMWFSFHPFAVFVILSLLSYLTYVYFGVKVGGESFTVITGITIHNVEKMYFVEMMFGCICGKYAGYTRVETTSEDGCKPCFFEFILISPLPGVFKFCFILGLIVGCVKVIYSTKQTCIHNGEVLIG